MLREKKLYPLVSWTTSRAKFAINWGAPWARKSACEAGRLLEAEQRKISKLRKRVHAAEAAAEEAKDAAESLRRERDDYERETAALSRRCDTLQRSLDAKEKELREVRGKQQRA